MWKRRIIQAGTMFTFLLFIASPLFATEIVIANGEGYVAGTVIGDYMDTHANDGVYESIQERESGGKPSNRYSFLEHKWTFDVPIGSAVTFYLKAYHTTNTEGDDFDFAWSSDDQSYTHILQVTKTVDDGTYQSASLPPDLYGTVYIRVCDADRSQGNRTLDMIYVDHMCIESAGFEVPPAAPTDLVATASSSSSIELTWSDNSVNEDGFSIIRSLDGINWDPPVNVGANITSYQDTGLDPSTTYYYAVQAFNTYGDSDWSNVASDSTFVEGSFVLEMVAPGGDGGPHAYNPLTGFPGIAFFHDEGTKIAEWDGVDWNIETVSTEYGLAGSFAYAPDGTPCMTMASSKTLWFAHRTGSSWTFEAIELKSKVYFEQFSVDLAFDHDGNPSIAYKSSIGVMLARRINGIWEKEQIVPERQQYIAHAYDLEGNPAIAFSSGSDGSAYGTDAWNFAHWNGGTWDIEMVESGVSGYGVKLDLEYDQVTGYPAIINHPWPGPLYPPVENMQVRLVRWNGAGWYGETIVFGAGDGSLAIDTQGTPFVSYMNQIEPGLWVAQWDGVEWQHELVDPVYSNLNFSDDIQIDPNGEPSVSYSVYQSGTFDLKFAHK